VYVVCHEGREDQKTSEAHHIKPPVVLIFIVCHLIEAAAAAVKKEVTISPQCSREQTTNKTDNRQQIAPDNRQQTADNTTTYKISHSVHDVESSLARIRRK
jgi:hypothetical protein